MIASIDNSYSSIYIALREMCSRITPMIVLDAFFIYAVSETENVLQ